MRVIKFKRVHFYDEAKTKLSHISFWGCEMPEKGCFTSPANNNKAIYYIDYQFIGLHDKNGTEIYEGDVIRLASGRVFEIIFKDGGFGYYINDDFIGFSGHRYLKIILSGEIIGNIYENPELLETK